MMASSSKELCDKFWELLGDWSHDEWVDFFPSHNTKPHKVQLDGMFKSEELKRIAAAMDKVPYDD